MNTKSIINFIEEGDQIISLIDSFFYDEECGFKGSGNSYRGLDIRDKYVEYVNSVYDNVKKLRLTKIEKSTFVPINVTRMPTGAFAGSFVEPKEMHNILKEIKQLIINLKKDLRVTSEKIPTIDFNIKKLDSIKISFNEEMSFVGLGNKKYYIEPGSKEFDICKFLFSKNIGELFSWDEVCDENEPDFNSKAVYDAIRRMNDKVKMITPTDDKLFNWRNKNISRSF